MEHQCEQMMSSGYGTSTNPSEQSQKSSTPTAPLPPPPPPPPPPLPTFELLPTPIKLENKKKTVIPTIKNGLPTGKELLRDLKKVQLRKIEKSPGGGPLKKPKKINNPGDFLEAALKKRFGLIQNSSESSIDVESLGSHDSFNSDKNNSSSNNYQVGKNIKYTFS